MGQFFAKPDSKALDPHLVGYFCPYRDFGQSGMPDLKKIDSHYSHMILAFFCLIKNSQIGTGFITRNVIVQQLQNDIKYLQSEYQMKMVGSMISTPDFPWTACDDDIFLENLKKFVDDWGLQGLDWDCDGSDYRDKYPELIPKVRKAFPDLFLSVVVYQYGSDVPMLKVIKDDIDALYTMGYSNDLDTIISDMKFYAETVDKSKVYGGIKIGLTSPEVVKELAEFSKENGYGGVMIWSADLDKKDSNGNWIYASAGQTT